MYGSLSLCEHIASMVTLTVINCCIFRLDAGDGQREVSAASTATKPSWCWWYKLVCIFYDELGGFSRFLLVPEYSFFSTTIIINRWVGFTGQGDSGSWSKRLYWWLSHSHLTAGSYGKQTNKSFRYPIGNTSKPRRFFLSLRGWTDLLRIHRPLSTKGGWGDSWLPRFLGCWVTAQSPAV